MSLVGRKEERKEGREGGRKEGRKEGRKRKGEGGRRKAEG